MKSLEAVIPTEVVALYTAIIAGCQSILNKDAHTTYLAFRLIIYLVALLCTVFIAFGSVHPWAKSAGKVKGIVATALSPELLTASLAFAAWGLLLPGSFLYVWLSSPLLSIVVITVTAATAFLLGALFAPWLRGPGRSSAASSQSSARPQMTPTVPTKVQQGAPPAAPAPPAPD